MLAGDRGDRPVQMLHVGNAPGILFIVRLVQGPEGVQADHGFPLAVVADGQVNKAVTGLIHRDRAEKFVRVAAT